MIDESFEIYNFEKLTITVQNELVKRLIEQSEFKVSKDNLEKLNKQIEVCRINKYFDDAIKAALKPKKSKKKAKVAEEVSEEILEI